MGTVPPRIIPPNVPPAVRGNDLEALLAQWDAPVEVGGYMQDEETACVPIGGVTAQEAANALAFVLGVNQVDQGESLTGQYEDAIVEYGEC